MHLALVFTPHMAQGVSVRISLHPRVIYDVTCLSVRWLFLVLSPFSFSPTSTFFSFNVYPFSVGHTIFNVDTAEV